jgi:hypothetical protein
MALLHRSDHPEPVYENFLEKPLPATTALSVLRSEKLLAVLKQASSVAGRGDRLGQQSPLPAALTSL